MKANIASNDFQRARSHDKGLAQETPPRDEPGLRFVPADTADLLGALGPGAVPALSRAAVAEPNAQIRWIAVTALGKVDPTTKATRAALERVVAEQSGDVQQEAAHILEELASRPSKQAPSGR